VSSVVSHPLRGRGHAAWMVVASLIIGVGLIAMHAGIACAGHGHAGDAHRVGVVLSIGDEALHAPVCLDCASRSAMTVVCAVLLLAVSGRVAQRVVRRLVAHVRVIPSSLRAVWWCWPRTAGARLSRAPDLHALQVMRC
jgi:hypothetical protein